MVRGGGRAQKEGRGGAGMCEGRNSLEFFVYWFPRIFGPVLTKRLYMWFKAMVETAGPDHSFGAYIQVFRQNSYFFRGVSSKPPKHPRTWRNGGKCVGSRGKRSVNAISSKCGAPRGTLEGLGAVLWGPGPGGSPLGWVDWGRNFVQKLKILKTFEIFRNAGKWWNLLRKRVETVRKRNFERL